MNNKECGHCRIYKAHNKKMTQEEWDSYGAWWQHFLKKWKPDNQEKSEQKLEDCLL